MHDLQSNKRLTAHRIYLVMNGATGLFGALVFTVFSLYQVTTVGLNPLQLVLVGTALEASVMLFEVPTGVVADLYSRRLSVIIGMFITGLGFALQGLIPVFEAILLASVIWGIGHTFISGASEAWIADEIDDDQQMANIYLRATQFRYAGSLIGIALSVLLAAIAIQIPLVLGGLLFMALGLWLVGVMPEDGFSPIPAAERETFRDMMATLREATRLVRGRPTLLTIMLITLFYGMFSEGFDRLWTKHLIDDFTFPGQFDAVVWFGLIGVVATILSIIVNEITRRRVDITGAGRIVRVLFIVNAILFGGLLLFAQSPFFALTLVAYWAVGVMRGLYGPLWVAWVNQYTEKHVRATMMSAASQMDAVGQIAGGPLIGLVGNASGTRTAISASAMLLTPVLALYLWLMSRHRQRVAALKEPVVEA